MEGSSSNLNIDLGAFDDDDSAINVSKRKRKGQEFRSWIRVDSSGNSQVLQVDKFSVMRDCNLRARDLRLVDPLLVCQSTILGREKAVVVNLDQIRCIITADEAMLLHPLDSHVRHYVAELQRRLLAAAEMGEVAQSQTKRDFDITFEDTLPYYLPFEFVALEVALETAQTFLYSEATGLDIEARSLMDELASKINTINLESVRQLKTQVLAVTRRTIKMRDEIEDVVCDTTELAEMCLTEKKRRMESSFYNNIDHREMSFSSSPKTTKLRKKLSFAKSWRENIRTLGTTSTSVDELERLLEANFFAIGGTINKLKMIEEYIDNSEDRIHLNQDIIRNQLLQFQVLLVIISLAVCVFDLVIAIFGMHFPIPIYDDPTAFGWVITGGTTIFVILFFFLFFKYKRFLPL